MRLNQLWRTTTFRLTLLYGLVFAVGTVSLLGMVYLQSAVYLTQRVDGILNAEAQRFAQSPPDTLRQRVNDALALDDNQTNVFALFSADGHWIAGNLRALPANLEPGGSPVEIAPTAAFPSHARLIAKRLPSGLEFVVGRDVNQLREMRAIIASALIWSGLSIIVVGLGFGTSLSIRPLRRLRTLQAAAHKIASGELNRRMPLSNRHDELDMFAATVNFMMDEVERLMVEVKGSTESIAHDLRTPLTRARSKLHRIRQAEVFDAEGVDRVTAEIDGVLDRFRALLRISELEARRRRAGFSPTDLGAIVGQVVDLYQPLADERGVRLANAGGCTAVVDADPKLLFEAVSNLVDNAIKFSPPDAEVTVGLNHDRNQPQIIVQDRGPGIMADERAAVLQRFYRSEHNHLTAGSGLGLSIVAAIARLHHFQLSLQDGAPGLKAVIDCRPNHIRY
jgi:signal transduction histidine kinase